jgi:hypothetical protein
MAGMVALKFTEKRHFHSAVSRPKMAASLMLLLVTWFVALAFLGTAASTPAFRPPISTWFHSTRCGTAIPRMQSRRCLPDELSRIS